MNQSGAEVVAGVKGAVVGGGDEGGWGGSGGRGAGLASSVLEQQHGEARIEQGPAGLPAASPGPPPPSTVRKPSNNSWKSGSRFGLIFKKYTMGCFS